MVGNFLVEAVATLLNLAKSTSDPGVAVGFLDKAAELNDRINAGIGLAPDASPVAPDVQKPERSHSA